MAPKKDVSFNPFNLFKEGNNDDDSTNSEADNSGEVDTEKIDDDVAVTDSVADERMEMIRKADELIANIAKRKSSVRSLLEQEQQSSEWAPLVRASCLVPSYITGQIAANAALRELMGRAEPVFYQFIDDLVAIRTKVTLILSSLNNGSEGGGVEMFPQDTGLNPTPAMRFITLIKVIESMNKWTGEVMDSWVAYHLNREQLKQGIDVENACKGQGFEQTDDMCQALALWDIKQAKEMRSMLNGLLYHYITLEDIVLEATGSVAEMPKTPSYSNLYV